MQPTPTIALQAKLYLRHSQSTDVLTEEGRQVNNSNLNLTAAYREDGAPRMGFSREPADFAFTAYVKTKTSDINSTEGKNVLQAMNQSAPSIHAGNSSSNGEGGNGDVMAARNNSSAETSKGANINLNA